jgi:diacylglycerol kinase
MIKNGSNRFSFRQRLKSFGYAFMGLRDFFSTQHNAIIHLAVTVIVFLAGWYFHLSRLEWAAITIVAAMVWAAELFNTAIEKMMDLYSKEFHPGIRFVKDVAAAAVLICAISAVVVGLLVFLPKIISWRF